MLNSDSHSRTSEIRSEEVQEILSHIPNWMIRWGITIVFLLILLVLGLCYLVRYPDVVVAKAMIITEHPPFRLESKVSRRIIKLYKNNGDQVKKGDIIASLDNPISEKTILEFQNHLQIIRDLKNNGILSKSDTQLFAYPLDFLQQNYNELLLIINNIKEIDINNYLNNNKISLIEKQILNYKNLSNIYKRQLLLQENVLKNAELKYKFDKELFEQSDISMIDYVNNENNYIQAKNSVNNINSTIVQNEITINDLQHQIDELRYEKSHKLLALNHQFDTKLTLLFNDILKWRQNNQIVAPISGTLHYLNNCSVNQTIKEKTEIFAVIPVNNQYYIDLKIPIHGAGKVKIGHKVFVEVADFPSHQYGELVGYVTDLSLLSSHNGQYMEYSAKAHLPNGVLSSYKIKLTLNPEMHGTAKIVTDDLRIIERVFNRFKGMF